MVQFKIPLVENLVDQQFFQVPVADGLLEGFQYDKQTNTLYAKESQIIIPSRHGLTHIGEDPIPTATCDSLGLMSADDKCKLDALLQMRLGILGFQGAGFPDDGGFLVGDIILAAGTDFVTIERIGNVVRINVDSPLPLNCSCDTCSQLYWIQDESATRAIRPPSCNGVLPDVDVYGELKVYTFPQTTLLDPKNPLATLNNKGLYPSFIFQRYVNAVTPFESQLEVVLKRNANLTSQSGWSMTPGGIVKASCVWFMGVDSQGGQIKFEFNPETDPNLLGSLLYKGHLVTKKAAVIVDYNPAILSNNQYILRLWDIQNAQPIGDRFTSTNVWRYANPENTPTQIANPRTIALDSTVDVLPIGTLVDIWEFEITRNADGRITRSFFIKQPQLNPSTLWGLSAAVRFGDLFAAREEINDPVGGTAITASEVNIPDKRQFERTIWGMNNFEERLILADDGGEVESCDGVIQREPSGEPINNDVVADIDPSIPALRVLKQAKSLLGDINGDGIVDDRDLQLFMCAYGHSVFDAGYNARADFNQDGKVDIRDLAVLGQQFDLNIEKVSDRPIFLWHRSNHENLLARAKVGMPDTSLTTPRFPPYDFLLSAPVDSFDENYMKILRRGVFVTGAFAGAPYIVVKGVSWKELPSEGVLRILTGAFRNAIWRYYFKCNFANWDDDSIVLVGRTDVFPFDEDFPIGSMGTACTFKDGSSGVTEGPLTDFSSISNCDLTAVEVPTNTTVTELLRQDFTSPCIRLQFAINHTTGAEAVQLQFKVGILDMSRPYECNDATAEDDLVRGLAPGYTVSEVMIQNGFITDGIGADVVSTPAGFRVYKGGELPVPVAGQTERFNDIEIMFRDNQVWIWWNGMLVPPNTIASANLPTPVVVNTPYFPINPQLTIGKFALRMFPGAIVRSVEVRDQLQAFSEYTHSQLELTN